MLIINKTKMFYNSRSLHIFVSELNYFAMRMQTYAANQMREIEDFVNEKGIDRKNIVDIFQSKEGDFILVYYAE